MTWAVGQDVVTDDDVDGVESRLHAGARAPDEDEGHGGRHGHDVHGPERDPPWRDAEYRTRTECEQPGGGHAPSLSRWRAGDRGGEEQSQPDRETRGATEPPDEHP